MPGSRVWFVYTSDDGKPYAVFLDKSNYLNSQLGFTRLQSGVSYETIPKHLKMRYAETYDASTTSRRRRFYIGTLAAYNGRYTNRVIQAPLTAQESPTNWIITCLRGERRRLPYSGETGLNDGTN